jgi:hypothetical protein
MAIRLNEALRASVGSTDAPNRVLAASVCRTDARWQPWLRNIPAAGSVAEGLTRA